ncbi:GNAT family N-acetyltransferase [Lentzea indica]|uniref:GNAT family N-acetyltransferase n=1 Tax=Lentzea indica TaxID=2604800 RepID=UPI001FE28BCA|nr:GNAT family N-acetyltransferase [Lentzea indica]
MTWQSVSRYPPTRPPWLPYMCAPGRPPTEVRCRTRCSTTCPWKRAHRCGNEKSRPAACGWRWSTTFAYTGPSRDADAGFELYAIYFLPSAWGSGLAEPLAQAALGDSRDAIVWVLEENKRARRFYERLGFAPDGTTRQETIGSAVLNEVRYRR